MLPRSCLLVLAAGLAAAASMGTPPGLCPHGDAGCRGDAQRFSEFQREHGKAYGSAVEEEARFSCFRKALALIEARNREAGPGGEWAGLNHLGDLCPEEAIRLHGGLPEGWVEREGAPIPSEEGGSAGPAGKCRSVDWRKKGAVAPVMNQLYCGSSLYLAIVANMASRYFLAGHPLKNLSAEAILECSPPDSGCNGALWRRSYPWITKNGGLPSAKRYPYTSGNGTTGQCNEALTKPIAACYDSVKYLAHSEKVMADEVYKNGPIQTAAYAVEWQNYRGGIMRYCETLYPDVGTYLVGFDECNVPPYWIVASPYGTQFGNDGYLYIEMGKNLCNLTSIPNTVVVKKGGGCGGSG